MDPAHKGSSMKKKNALCTLRMQEDGKTPWYHLSLSSHPAWAKDLVGHRKYPCSVTGTTVAAYFVRLLRHSSVRCFWKVFCFLSPPTHTDRRLSDRRIWGHDPEKHTCFRSLHYRIQYSIHTAFCQGGICEFMGNGTGFPFWLVGENDFTR